MLLASVLRDIQISKSSEFTNDNNNMDKEPTNAERIVEGVTGYVSEFIRNTWPDLRFRNPRGRLESCLGFVAGIYLAGNKDLAEQLADSLFRSLQMAEGSERIKSQKTGVSHPKQIVSIGDDGYFMSMLFCLYYLNESGEYDFPWHDGMDTTEKYSRAYNGGIIFHGCGENFTVTPNNSIGWSVHT